MAGKYSDDDLIHMQDTIVEKSDRLAREYKKELERRARHDRGRRPDDESPSARPKRSKAKRSRSSSRPRKSGSAAPLPPDEGDARRQARAETRPRSEPAPPPPTAPERVAPPRSTMDQLAMELDEQLREARFRWRGLRGADKLTLVCAFFMAVGVLLPWRSDPAHPLQIGLTVGGGFHLALAALAFALVLRSASKTTMRAAASDLASDRRASLWLVLCGAASTLAGAYFLLLIGLEKAPDWSVNIHFGVYWTLVSGTGVSYGGFARFSAIRGSTAASS